MGSSWVTRYAAQMMEGQIYSAVGSRQGCD